MQIHKEFVDKAVEVLSKDTRLVGIAAGGSWITNTLDEYSDIDLVIVVDPDYEQEISTERLKIASKLGNLLSGFTGEHVGEPRLIICLYGPELLHVDLKFVSLADVCHRVEDPVILWERDGLLKKAYSNNKAEYPLPDLQWIEDRFWTWIHYTITKIERGELFEVIDAISFLRSRVLGPLALMKKGKQPRGLRFIERDAKEYMPLFIKTLPGYSKISCITALEHTVNFYRVLRDSNINQGLELRKAAEEQIVNYLKSTADKIKS